MGMRVSAGFSWTSQLPAPWKNRRSGRSPAAQRASRFCSKGFGKLVMSSVAPVFAAYASSEAFISGENSGGPQTTSVCPSPLTADGDAADGDSPDADSDGETAGVAAASEDGLAAGVAPQPLAARSTNRA